MLKFDINLVLTLINLVIFFVLVRLVLFKPIKKVLDKRKELVENQFKEADLAKEQADELKAQYEAQLEEADTEKQQILQDAQDDARAHYDKIISKAREDAEKIKSDARQTAEFEAQSTMRAVKEEIAALAMETAEKVVGKEVSSQTDSDLYDKFLNESSENNE